MARYTNLDGTTPDKGLGDLIRWQLNRKKDTTHFTTPVRENDGSELRSESPHLTWIGHATYALRLAKKMIVTDPVWSERVGPQRRKARPGVAFEKMPRVDVVTVSHTHFDHLDFPTLRRIGADALYVVPKDVGELLRAEGLRRVVELGWWDTHEEGDLQDHARAGAALVDADAVGSQQAPLGRLRDRVEPEGTAYHAGDTAFSERVFSEIAARFPSIDWAMLPIGAYDPVWFMGSQHMGPEEAVKAFEILGAKTFCAMHWGTFKLTDEPLGEPPARVRAHWREREANLATGTRLHVPDVGETLALRA